MNIKLVAIPAIALAASLGLADTLGHHSTFTQAMRRLGNLLWESNYMGEAKAWKLAHGPMSTKQAMLESLTR
jgi:hypothetical protein